MKVYAFHFHISNPTLHAMYICLCIYIPTTEVYIIYVYRHKGFCYTVPNTPHNVKTVGQEVDITDIHTYIHAYKHTQSGVCQNERNWFQNLVRYSICSFQHTMKYMYLGVIRSTPTVYTKVTVQQIVLIIDLAIPYSAIRSPTLFPLSRLEIIYFINI